MDAPPPTRPDGAGFGGDGDAAAPQATPTQRGMTENGKTQTLFKVLIVGDYATGKTSIIRRYTEGTFDPNYKLTIGVDFALKTLDWSHSEVVNLQLWDIAGHERFGCMTRAYYRYAIAACVVFDLSRPATLDAAAKWKADVDSKVMLENEERIPCILLANKCDLDTEQQRVTDAQIDVFSQENGFWRWFKISAMTDLQIDAAFRALVERIIAISARVEQAKAAEVTLTAGAAAGGPRVGKQCCA